MKKILIAWIIIACEVGFWIFVLAGLIARYVFNQRKLGNLLLICTPIVDLLLLVATVIDLKNGAVATTVHGIAAIYIGVSIAFGHRMIAWADVRFAYYFRNGPKPDKKKKYGSEYAKIEREGWFRHLLSWVIGSGIIFAIIYYIDNNPQTEQLFHIFRLWSIILIIDFLISFSYTVFPRQQKGTF